MPSDYKRDEDCAGSDNRSSRADMVARQAKARRSRHHHCPRRHLYEIYVRYLLRLSYSALGIVERGQTWAVWGFQTRLWPRIDSSLREPVSKANDGPGSALAALSGSERPVSPKECESKKRSGQIRMTNSFFDTCRQQQKPLLVNQSWNNPRESQSQGLALVHILYAFQNPRNGASGIGET